MTDEAFVPPQNLDAEESVLGALLLSKHAITAVSDVVRPDDFYRETHGVIFQTALDLDARGEPVDAISLAGELDRIGKLEYIGGKFRVHELASLAPATANAHRYAELVREAARKRALIAAGRAIADLGWTGVGDVDELIDKAEKELGAVTDQSYGGEFGALSDSIDSLYEEVAEAVRSQTPLSGVPSGFPDLDRMTTGFYPGQLIIIAARPGVGKSVGLLNILENLADRGKPSALFTLEMSSRELSIRSLVRETRLDMNKLRTGRLTHEDLEKVRAALPKLKGRPIYVEDNPGVTMAELRARARRLKAKHGLEAIGVDYLQLMLSGQSTESRQVEVAQISRQLKLLAMELHVPVLAVSQLSRKTESREDKRPMLSDLRDSGAIEQDADVVVFIYREEVYKQVEAERGGEAEWIVAKNRMGEQGTVKLLFLGRRQTFASPARFQQNGAS